MKIVVDANIIFSGILNCKGKIGDLLINSYGTLDFMAPDFLRQEIKKHYPRLCSISKLKLEQVQEAEYQVCKDIKFISEEQISNETWQEAFELVKDIDIKDIQYVAFVIYFNRKLWSGDKVLVKGLAKKDFKNFLTTDELYQAREHIKLRSKRKR